MSISDSVSHCDLIEAIVEGLPEDYSALGAIIQYRTDPCDLLDAKSMLLSHEAKLEKQKQLGLLEPISINLAQSVPQSMPPTVPQPPPQVANQVQVSSPQQSEDDNGDYQAYNTCGGSNGGRSGRSGSRNRVQCQICSKHDHDASTCWHHYSGSGGGASQSNGAPAAPNQNQGGAGAQSWTQAPANPGPNNWFGPATSNYGPGSWFGPGQWSGHQSQWTGPQQWAAVSNGPSQWFGPHWMGPPPHIPNWNPPPSLAWDTLSHSSTPSGSMIRPYTMASPSQSTNSTLSNSHHSRPQAYLTGSD